MGIVVFNHEAFPGSTHYFVISVAINIVWLS